MTAKSKAMPDDWIGGLVAMPAYVTGEGEPYRPEVLLWLDARGIVLGHALDRPGALLALACDSLRGTIAQPMVGPPHAPDRVRVASAELAGALRAGCPGLQVVLAPTPEIDEVFDAMGRSMTDTDETERSYLSPELGPAAVAAFFRAAAALFRAKPWKVVPDDQSLFSVTIESLGVTDAVLSVIGQMGQSLGVILFSGIDDFDAFVAAGEAIDRGDRPVVPPHLALNFERKANLSPALREEIAAHRWEVAGARGYPSLVPIDADLVVRPLTSRDLSLAEALALALAAVLADKRALHAAWHGGEPVARTLRVATHAGEVEVTLRVPYPRHAAA